MHYGERLKAHLAAGKARIEQVRARATNVLKVMARLKLISKETIASRGLAKRCAVGPPAKGRPSPNSRPQRELLLKAATDSIVLLRNEGALPLSAKARIVV